MSGSCWVIDQKRLGLPAAMSREDTQSFGMAGMGSEVPCNEFTPEPRRRYCSEWSVTVQRQSPSAHSKITIWRTLAGFQAKEQHSAAYARVKWSLQSSPVSQGLFTLILRWDLAHYC